jgi:hypothetical protein
VKKEAQKARRQRIAVILDASGHGHRDLELTLAIAAALQAEVEGVFVEDSDLLSLAALPFLREVRGVTLNEEQVSEARLRLELRGLARQARNSLESTALRHGVTCSFRVWRGSAEAEILTAALEAEMLSLAPTGSHAPFSVRPPRLSPREKRTGLAITVLFNDSDTSFRALDAASQLARSKNAELKVLLQPSAGAKHKQLRKKACSLLGEDAPSPVFLLAGSSAAELAQAIVRAGSDLLVVDAANPLLAGRTIWQFVQTVHCPLLLVR